MLSRVTCEHSFATKRERNMKRNTGLWIDHKEAFIVFLSADAHGEALTKHMVSDDKLTEPQIAAKVREHFLQK